MSEDARAEEGARLRKTATYLAGLGLSVFPLHHPWESPFPWVQDWDPAKMSGKRPAVRWREYQDVAADRRQVEQWWGGETLYNIGLPTGKLNGFDVIDGDSPAALAWMADNLPSTPVRVMSSSAARQHWFYRHKEGVGNSARLETDLGKLALDVRGHGGYVVSPGSRHRAGTLYSRAEGSSVWTREALAALPGLPGGVKIAQPPPPVPSFIFPVDRLGDAYKRAAAWLAKRDPAVAGEGGDAHTYATAAFLVRDFALPTDQAWALLCEWNLGCQPPWGERDLKEKLDNAARYAKNPPGSKLLDRPLGAEPRRISYPWDKPRPDPADLEGPPQDREPEANPLDDLISMETVTARDVEFVMFPWLPVGELVMLSGDGGTGKSLVTESITACVTGGAVIPDMPVERTGPVLVFSAEDDPDTILKPRLDAAGADCSLVKAYPMHEQGFAFDSVNIAKFESYVAALRPVLVVIDPIVAFMDAKVDMNQANQVRSVLDRLRWIADAYQACILIVVHHSKSGVMYGSVDFRNRPRSVLTVYRDPENDSRMYVAHEKANYAPKALAIPYMIEQPDPEDRKSVRVRWYRPQKKWTSEELRAAQVSDFDKGAIQDAEAFLIEELSEGKMTAHDVKKSASKLGITSAHVAIARRRLGIDVFKVGVGADGEWYMRMPSAAASFSETFDDTIPL